ncbi:MAG TPA: hypothetical protein GXZ36_05215 [Firmicutes bacterium]|nr:hypothetical protein [Bacillota bacterium]
MKTFYALGEWIRLFFRNHCGAKIAMVSLLVAVGCLLLYSALKSSLVWGTVCFFGAAAFLLFLHFKVKTRYPICLWIALFLFGLAFFSLMFMSKSIFCTYLFPLYLLGLGIGLLMGDPSKFTLALRSRIGKGQ